MPVFRGHPLRFRASAADNFQTIMRIVSKAPCRVDLAGGTLDIWPLYLYHEGALTVNFAVDRYASCALDTRTDSRLVLRSRDQGIEESFASLDHLLSATRYRLPLIAWQLRFFRPPAGLTIETNSEAPAGAGISGSSALIIAINAALNRLLGTRYSLEKIRQISQNTESQVIRVPTGSQDYYPAMYGGVNVIRHGPGGIERRAIPVDLAELDARSVLAYTGEPRQSGANNWKVIKAHLDGDRKVQRNFDRIAVNARAMHDAVQRADWQAVGALLRREWAHRRRNVATMTTPAIDRLIAVARRAGAIGARACGAGGGGCVYFLVESGARERVAGVVERAGAQVLPMRVARRGVRVRTVPE